MSTKQARPETYQEQAYRTAQTDYEACEERVNAPFMTTWLFPVLDTLMRAGLGADLIKRHVFYGAELEQLARRADGDKKHQEGLLTAAAHRDLVIDDSEKLELLHALLGLVSEAAELAEALIPVFYHGYEVDFINIAEELGDLRWYSALAASAIGETEEDIEAVNIGKLRARYPEKFSADNALHRDLDAERKALGG